VSIAPPNVVAAAAAGAGLRRAADDLRPPVLRFALRAVFLTVRFAARFRDGVFRALALRDAPARERAVRFVLRAALDLRLAAALRLRVALLFFLARAIVLLR
jgi:hypothetical protein